MKKYIFSLISIFISIYCMTKYIIIGQEIAPDGTLIEPFYLIPFSYFFMSLGIISGLIIMIISFIRKTKKSCN